MYLVYGGIGIVMIGILGMVKKLAELTIAPKLISTGPIDVRYAIIALAAWASICVLVSVWTSLKAMSIQQELAAALFDAEDSAEADSEQPAATS